MPIPSLITAIVSRIIESAADQPASPPADALQQGPAVGIVRTLPAESLHGMLSSASIGSIVIDGKTLPLSPGAQIRNQGNLIVMPTMIQQEVPVRYVVDALGYVTRIWILTPAELAASL